jgi:hypothetical protein
LLAVRRTRRVKPAPLLIPRTIHPLRGNSVPAGDYNEQMAAATNRTTALPYFREGVRCCYWLKRQNIAQKCSVVYSLYVWSVQSVQSVQSVPKRMSLINYFKSFPPLFASGVTSAVVVRVVRVVVRVHSKGPPPLYPLLCAPQTRQHRHRPILGPSLKQYTRPTVQQLSLPARPLSKSLHTQSLHTHSLLHTQSLQFRHCKSAAALISSTKNIGHSVNYTS